LGYRSWKIRNAFRRKKKIEYSEDPAKVPDHNGQLYIPKKSLNISELKLDRFAKKEHDRFTQIKFDFDNELEALLEINYSNPRQTKVRLFFGKEGKETIYSRDYIESSGNNFIHFRMIPSPKQRSTQWVKKGIHDVGDNFESGYTLELFMRDADKQLRKFLIDLLMSKGFGCLPASRTIHCHLDDDHPNDDKAKEHLENILYEITRISENS